MGLKMQSSNYSGTQKKIVILGMDGLSPDLMEAWMQDGSLPNFLKLKQTGTYTKLETTTPPESPVAWTSFASGSNPGKHSVFDFIKHDPKNYKLNSFLDHKTPARKNTAFWQYTSRHKIPTYVFFCPNTNPPDKVFGKLIGGMGVPDLRGSHGIFTFYTSKEEPYKEKVVGDVIKVRRRGNLIITQLRGPHVIGLKGKRDHITVPLYIEIDGAKAIITLQGKSSVVHEKSWSPWFRVSFRINLFRKIHGMCKFYLKSISPDFMLYCTPINLDPYKPLLPITYPKNYSAQIADKLGLYYTQGMPMDTWALNEDRIDDATFLEQAQEILDYNEKLLFLELKEFKQGVFFFYFEYPDIIQHMFWRYIDKEHPRHNDKEVEMNGNVIKDCYQRMDAILGKVLVAIDKDTVLIVLSDHGFNTFRRQVHLSRWLKENGFLFLKDNKEVGNEMFADVDWSRTRAYSVGFNGIYINQIGRQGHGIVRPGEETEELKKEIILKLQTLKDGNKDVVHKVYTREEIYHGPYVFEAPDLVVGYYPGYRGSWKTGLGAVPKELIEDNTNKWSGDHLFDAALMPAVLFINQKVTLKNPRIIDLAPTIMKLLGLSIPKDMDGEPLF
ncbi:MAG: alkaline phosphatase family protein [Candidatus Omnitrophica bacterium]|nr:alkaline phosphatase family protein [Candidatus Omnitrophota bacterium]